MVKKEKEKNFKETNDVLNLYFEVEEILERPIIKLGNSGRISIPAKHVGKQSKVFIFKKKLEKLKEGDKEKV